MTKRRNNTFLIFSLLFAIIIILSCSQESDMPPDPPPPTSVTLIRGLDLSFAPEISSYNIQYKANGEVKPLLKLVKDKGINTIRVRLWYNPASEHSSYEEVKYFAAQIKQEGLKFWLDFHYSDTWADPGNQTKPQAWANANFDQLQDSVYAYTKRIMSDLKQNNLTPEYVQIGNEINNGMLWNDGKIYKPEGEDWENIGLLLKTASSAIREVSSGTLIMIHYAGYEGADVFFNKLSSIKKDYDIIGLSYYNWWHGNSSDELKAMINKLNYTYSKPVVIAEAAYPWTLGWNDYTNNLVGLESHLAPGYPATPEGQAQMMANLIDIITSTAYENNSGICYWAPDWVAYKGTTATDGSPWENLTLFNFENEALPALDTLGRKDSSIPK